VILKDWYMKNIILPRTFYDMIIKNEEKVYMKFLLDL